MFENLTQSECEQLYGKLRRADHENSRLLDYLIRTEAKQNAYASRNDVWHEMMDVKLDLFSERTSALIHLEY